DYDGNDFSVKNFNLTVDDGEFVVLVGPSGCGKSTTLRMVAGLEEVSSGKIFIGDRCVNDVLPKDRNIAMVFQNYALYPDKTVYENMAFCLRMRKHQGICDRIKAMFGGGFDEDIDKSVREAASILGIEELLERRPRELSGGQRQRVAVGRCIVRQPYVFLFDEPLSNLDAKMRVQMRTEISRLHNRLKATMLYVTHDQTEAMTMGNRIVVMKDGVIQQVATPAEIYGRPCNEFVAGFIGTPPMNFFDASLESKDDQLCVCLGGTALPLPKDSSERLSGFAGEGIRLGLRPEHIGSASEDGACQLTASVEVVEPLGSETLVYLKSECGAFVAKVDAQKRYRVGENVTLPVQMEMAHFFSKQGKNLLCQ
ncbi:MAG: sn-glycerol-3-phosphate ABC transporter ATP-binding protein UgpC, partial [Victivallales bacterium]|nr:sn-glycerol-3-phosphate ABC transporter ATP-binding protein UgpC [Victivallales bacterium]